MFPEVMSTLLDLLNVSAEVDENVLKAIEWFIIPLYDKTSELCNVNDVRKELFTRKGRSIEHTCIPLNKAALRKYIESSISSQILVTLIDHNAISPIT